MAAFCCFFESFSVQEVFTSHYWVYMTMIIPNGNVFLCVRTCGHQVRVKYIQECFVILAPCTQLLLHTSEGLVQRVLLDLRRTKLFCRRVILNPPPLPPPLPISKLSQSSSVLPFELTDGRGGGGWRRIQKQIPTRKPGPP